jgi:predicted RNA-binding Zn-ribbon protein involved in translation (DUF1610 family)
MRPKVPWLPSELQPGSVAERCPSCGLAAFIPWTLRRDTRSKQVVRTWVCTECQVTEERPEPD